MPSVFRRTSLICMDLNAEKEVTKDGKQEPQEQEA